ncbi:Mitochondrial FAD-linked sulfhydryl oxidase ERV1 [Penicillium subrubescens]|uniref:Mitochondrial FAD-linked sulfhydryl oxidase ERV1 n=1 Tax=Penicillium subrubescens TaxID=1316194 RepID=UPI0025452F16|nr:Mitochondrial FAD-linked sulfhydryl oxidase ERV1 [Penicillium subrubescens]KAJ5886582.1 Mitochondrial FAD-linked sulfhydryl oxidase ERV1 [Penicillium subrubescens]
MAEVPPEQLDAQFHTPPHAFNQIPPKPVKDSQDGDSKAPLPKGVVLDKDGKPNNRKPPPPPPPLHQHQQQSPHQQQHPAQPPNQPKPPPDCPPDVEQLGRSTWTLLHTMAATYPEKASASHQEDMQGFLKFFSKLYPCWVCADDFRTWMAHPSGRNQPKLSGRKEFGWWMCEAHNEVNRKLGKKEFDCRLWEERWRTGWKDGRCD